MAGRLFSFYFCHPRRIISCFLSIILGFPRQHRSKESASQSRRCKRQGLSPLVRKITWRRKRQPTPVFMPKKFYGQRSLVGYSWATIPGVSKSWKGLSMHVYVHAHTHSFTLPLSPPWLISLIESNNFYTIVLIYMMGIKGLFILVTSAFSDSTNLRKRRNHKLKRKSWRHVQWKRNNHEENVILLHTYTK